MGRLRVVEFQLLQACNARCLYCAYEQNLSEYNEWLPLEIVERTLAEERPEWARFEGGEVTYSEASREYLLEATIITKRYGVKNRINTNAHNLDPLWVRRLPAGIIFTRKTKEPDPAAHYTLNIRQPYMIPGKCSG